MLNSVEFPKLYEKRRENIFLLDTDILSDVAKGGKSKEIRDQIISNGGITLFSLPSILELGFGTSENVNTDEAALVDDLRFNTMLLETSNKRGRFIANGKEVEKNKNDWTPLVPDVLNWFAAKKTMINYMEDRGAKPSNAKKLQFDILISCSAWNNNATVWTNNIKDHLLANYYMRYYECTRDRDKNSNEAKICIAKYMPPIFNTELLEKAINGDNFNIYDELIKKINNVEIIEILEISKTL